MSKAFVINETLWSTMFVKKERTVCSATTLPGLHKEDTDVQQVRLLGHGVNHEDRELTEQLGVELVGAALAPVVALSHEVGRPP